jgi:hypothetical protein
VNDEELLTSVLKIQSEIGSGTCFLFRDKRHALTAKHVVAKANGRVAGNIVVLDGAGKSHKVSTCQVLESMDVALVAFDHDLSSIPLDPVAGSDELMPGTKFRAPGFPEFVSETWQPGEMVGRSKLGRYEIHFDHSLTSQLSGLSGAPVLNPDNRVVGVISEHDPATPSAGKMVPLKDFQIYLDFVGPRAKLFCLVIFSDREPAKDGVLRTAVGDAKKKLDATSDKDWQGETDLKMCYATECVSSPESYANVIRDICRADICIFDLTGYEPAVMLLLGIRSVVKRSITIGTTSGEIKDAPYDIKELSLVDLAKVAEKGLKLRDVIAQRIRAGRAAQGLQHYLDLPTFDAVRNLPPGRRGVILDKECVLVLSSYAPQADGHFKYIQDRLEAELQGKGIEEPVISRVIDLNMRSPWLVSQNMYEAIRRTAKCIVDWTGFPEWPANVFFELGVRIAVRSSVTLSVLQDAGGTRQPGAEEELSEQQQNLIKLFSPIRYRLTDPTGEEVARMMEYWDGRPSDEPSTYTFQLITDAIDTRQGMIERGVISELLQAAELLSADSTEALSAVLYPQNRQLSSAAREAETERLWAAWHYLNARYTLAEIAQNTELCDAIKKIVVNLKDALGQDDPQVKLAQAKLKQLLELAK